MGHPPWLLITPSVVGTEHSMLPITTTWKLDYRRMGTTAELRLAIQPGPR
jgi:hypothetical protein